MNYTVVIDWKFPVAVGVAVAGIIFAVKMTAADAKEVSIRAIDACKECEITF